MNFLGIDIGYDRCGVCVIDFSIDKNSFEIVFAGSIITDKKLSFKERLKILDDDLRFIKNKYNPSYMCIEKLFFNRKNMIFEKICMSKGVALLVFNDIEILEIEPKRVKNVVVGDGNATKSQIKEVLEKLLNKDLSKVLDDTLDALCLALYNIDQYKIESLTTRRKY